MVQHFASLSLLCLRGQLEGLITDLPGLYSHASTTTPPIPLMKGGLLTSQEAPMRPWSWLKHRLMAVIYCMAPSVCVLFMCACISRTLTPVSFSPHNPPSSSQCNGSCKRMRRRVGAGYVTSLALVNTWLKVEGCWQTLRPWWAECAVFLCMWVLVLIMNGLLVHTVCACTCFHACVCMGWHLKRHCSWWLVTDSVPTMKRRSLSGFHLALS